LNYEKKIFSYDDRLTLRVVVISIQFQYGWISLIGKIRMILMDRLYNHKEPGKNAGSKIGNYVVVFCVISNQGGGVNARKKNSLERAM